jgi:hypothetical protein
MTGAARVLVNVRYGEMPVDEAETSVRLFAEKVLPLIHSSTG